MNLNEERKAPLREKDLSTKREMVVQYISATAKSVSETVRILQWCICKEAAVADSQLLNQFTPVLCSSCSVICHCTRPLLTLSHLLRSPCLIPSLLIAILILFPSQFQLRFNRADVNRHSLAQCKVDGRSVSSNERACRWLILHSCACMGVFLVAGDAALFSI